MTELEITNIRSYEHSLVRFQLGKTLFEGDVGSGKSTLLMAIEFALFGLGSGSGAALLRLGESEGGVKMKFDVDGREFEVRRGLLKKGARVQQTDGLLITPDEELALSPRELKERILDVLEFNEAPETKSQSLIFRYAVYTPQEEMREVLAMSADARLQTLRRAFRVEDYKTAVENSSEIARELRGDIREFEGLASGLEGLRERVVGMKRDQGESVRTLEALEESERVAHANVTTLRTEKQSLHEDVVKLEGLRWERRIQERVEIEGTRETSSLEKESASLSKRRAMIHAELRRHEEKKPRGLKIPSALMEEEREEEVEVIRLASLKATLEAKVGDYVLIMEKGICPVCDRPAKAHDIGKKKASREIEVAHVADQLEKAEARLEKVRGAREKYSRYLEEEGEAREKRAEVARLDEEIADRTRSTAEGRAKVHAAQVKLRELEHMSISLQGLAEKAVSSERNLARAEEALVEIRERLAAMRERSQMLEKRVVELEMEVADKERAAVRSVALKEREAWLTDYFEPTLGVIERSVLTTANQDFDVLFQRWFSMLVSDPEKEARVDEDFTPVVSQGGYEQDVKYLSGGERTSVALAYRFALNSLARRVSTGMKTNLLILDEPTDGFSREQLGSLREVLDDLGCQQVIIVSHDRELESCADQVIRIEKLSGVSVVASPGD